jgi:hypothetical protein
LLEQFGLCPDEDEVVVYRTILDECTLAGKDKLMHSGPQSDGKDFCEELGEEMYQAYGSKFLGVGRVGRFGQQYECGRV